MLYELLIELAKGLEEGFSEKVFRTSGAKKEEYKPPKVVIGIESPAKPRPQSDFPFVAVVPVEGRITEEGIFMTKVSFVCGIYTPERDTEAGLSEVLRLAESVIRVLRQKRCFSRFTLEGGFEVFHDIEKPHPFYLTEVTAVFVSRMPPELTSQEEVEHYGAGEY